MLSATPNAASCKAAIHLEGWGLPAAEIETLAEQLNGSTPGLHWHAGDAAMPGALTLMLVDVGALTGERGQASWNALGPVEAMRAARQRGNPVIAVCRGRVSHLPALRQGVWVASTSDAWDVKLASLGRALAALEWQPEQGYLAMQEWAAVRELARSDLLAVTISKPGYADFAGMLRGLGSIMPPVALCVAGVARNEFDRTLVEAGLHALAHAAATPMTLDGVTRVDGLVGFAWQGGQAASAGNPPQE